MTKPHRSCKWCNAKWFKLWPWEWEASLQESWTVATVVTSITAIVTAIVSFMNWRVTHDKFNLDLYNRRFAIYDAVIDFYMLQTGEIKSTDPTRVENIRTKFIKAWRETSFLFDQKSDIFYSIEKMRKLEDMPNNEKELERLLGQLEVALVRFIDFGKSKQYLGVVGLLVERD